MASQTCGSRELVFVPKLWIVANVDQENWYLYQGYGLTQVWIKRTGICTKVMLDARVEQENWYLYQGFGYSKVLIKRTGICTKVMASRTCGPKELVFVPRLWLGARVDQENW